MRKGGDFFPMNDIGWGLLLNLLFWVVVISAILFAAVWASVEFFLGAAQRVRKTVRAWGGRKDPQNPSQTDEEAGERYRKAS
jgi:hypothetical protein